MSLAMRVVFLLLLCMRILCAEEEIVVHLLSDEQLYTMAVTQTQGSGFDQNYRNALTAVLRFDLGHNGHTRLVKGHGSLLNLDHWKRECIDFVAEMTINNSQLSAKVLDVKTGSIKLVDRLALTGDLAKDRYKVHQISDAISETFFNTPGVATSRVLYTVRTRKSTLSSTWTSEVWEADYDGANPRQLTSDGNLCVTPIYMPLRGQFMVVSYKVGQPKIYVSDGTNLKRLSYLRGNQLSPALSPRNDLIAFISDISGNPDLFIQEFSLEKGMVGKPRQIFTAPMATQGTPTFSPDGTKIAFVSNKDGTPRIYVLPVPGLGDGTLKLISKSHRGNTCPAWSPDGKKIAYCSTVKGTRQIMIYDLEKNEEIQLTDGGAHKENPTWAPNSLHLMFNTEINSTAELYLINLKQKDAVKISSGSGEKRFPAWEPYHSQQKRI